MLDKLKEFKGRETYYELELEPDDYVQRVYPKIMKLREDLVDLYKELKEINRYLAYLMLPAFKSTERKLERLEKSLEDKFYDQNKPVP